LAVAVALGGGLLATPGVALASGVDAAATPQLTWADCDGGFQCATAQVPLDYDQPFGTEIDLALIRLPASDPGKRIGSLFVNFGGPGASGVDRLRQRANWDWLFSPELKSRFDLVSWDPRGIARSAGVRCFATEAEQQAFYASRPEMPADPTGENAFYANAKELADRCKSQAGALLDHVSTANTARDLELLRRAVGDAKLTYHGISYGTQLGAIYANLFPSRIRAMTFDGSMDFEGNINGHGREGTTVPLDTRQAVPTGMTEAFDYLLRECSAAGPACAFSSGDPKAKWTALTARARAQPIVIQGDSGQETWTYSAIINTVGDLSQPEGYRDIAIVMQKLYDASSVPATARVAAAGEPYLANRDEAFNAIQCADSVFPTDPAVYSRAAVAEDTNVPYFGRIGVFDMMSCAYWKGHDADRYTGPWNRKLSAPILVLNARYDPSTPLAGAYDGVNELANARVVVIEGAGHSSMFVHSTCAERVKRDYLVTATLPPEGTTCAIDKAPFA
jgi:pimeloyl-ACP methyl ester carboxylesterase